MATLVFQRTDRDWQVLVSGSVWVTTTDAELAGLCAASLHVRLLKEKRVSADEDVALGAGVTEEELRLGYVQLERLELFERRASQRRNAAPADLNE